MPSIGLPSTGICAETGRTNGPAHGVDAFNATSIRMIERGRRPHGVKLLLDGVAAYANGCAAVRMKYRNAPKSVLAHGPVSSSRLDDPRQIRIAHNGEPAAG